MFGPALRAWEAEHVGTVRCNVVDGRLVVESTDSDIIATNLEWLRTHGYGYVIEDDGAVLRLDEQHVYTRIRELEGPFTAYQLA